MAWTLRIRFIDVGQGDSTFVVAEDTSNPPQTRTILIDGGLGRYSEIAHLAMESEAPGVPVDHMLVTSYLDEHYEGLMDVLHADNAFFIADKIAEAAVAGADPGGMDLTQALGASAGAYAACLGGYDTPGGVGGVAARLAPLTTAARHPTAVPADMITAANLGWQTINNDLNAVPPNAPMLPPLNPVLVARWQLAYKISFGAGWIAADQYAKSTFPNGGADQATKNQIQAEVRKQVLRDLWPAIPPNTRFDTGGRYLNTHVIDNAPPGAGTSTLYLPALLRIPDFHRVVAGAVHIEGAWVRAPGVNRTLTSLRAGDLGREILWNSGPASLVSPAGAPGVFVVATGGQVWGTADRISAPALIPSEGIGLVVRLNEFFHYTAGDMPSAGAELIAIAVTTTGLPDPARGGAMAAATRIASIKCDGHGDAACTSQLFLNTGQPRVAFISCGKEDLSTSPSQMVVNRLHGQGSLTRFYLTNCNVTRTNVVLPGAMVPPGNKSQVCGDNATPNTTIARVRGDSRLITDTAYSTGPNRLFRVAHNLSSNNPGYNSIGFG